MTCGTIKMEGRLAKSQVVKNTGNTAFMIDPLSLLPLSVMRIGVKLGIDLGGYQWG